QLPFLMQTDLSFFMPGNLIFTLDFTKDETGHITRMVAFKRDQWKKVNKVTPTPAALRQYAGKYQSKDDPDNQISIIARDSALVVKQAWDGKETAYEAVAENFFFNNAASSPLEFVRDANGGIKVVRLFGNNDFIPVGH
ncbi:MAG TPA: hypothetical protein VKU83_04685, partial [Puia sp.]|nr:hypothetical protein [Puia sp.]